MAKKSNVSAIIESEKLILTRPCIDDMLPFIKAVKEAKAWLQDWVNPPCTTTEFKQYIKLSQAANNEAFLIKSKPKMTIIGVININEIVLKALKSGYLGFYTLHKPRTGLMSEALHHIINYAFYNLDLHRLEANVQPDNLASINFIRKNNFTEEGMSPNYLKIAGKWRDHLRFAITKEQLEKLYILNAHAKLSPWQPDFTITPQHLQHLCENITQQQFTTFTKIAEGWDNWIYLANNEIIFRLPRRYIAIALFARENKVLKLINDKVNLAIPNPKYSGFGDSQYPYQIQGYRKLTGKSTIDEHVTFENRVKSVSSFAKFLKCLHDIPLEALYDADIEATVFNRCDFTSISKNFDLRLKELQEHNTLSQNELTRIQDKYKTAKLANPQLTEQCLIHGDLYSRHLLFANNKLTSIIDWGDTGINNPAVDLAALYSFFPKESHAEFYAIYGEVNQACKDYASFLGIYSTINILNYALDIKNEALYKESKLSLEMQLSQGNIIPL